MGTVCLPVDSDQKTIQEATIRSGRTLKAMLDSLDAGQGMSKKHTKRRVTRNTPHIPDRFHVPAVKLWPAPGKDSKEVLL